MAIHGNNDSDDRDKKSLQKRDDTTPGRPKRDATELFNRHIEGGRMEELVDKVFDAWERGLESPNDGLAVSTADKFTKAFYNPDKKVVVEGQSPEQVQYNILMNQDNLNDKERAALNMFKGFLEKQAQAQEEGEVVEGEVVEEEESD